MWFQYPEGSEAISVELQEFHVEAKDSNGRCYFRAPDHFAGTILALPGYVAKEPPEGSTDLADLPQSDPLRDDALRQLSAQIEGLRLENGSLKARHAELHAENQDLKLKANDLQTRLNNLHETGNEDGVITESTPKKK